MALAEAADASAAMKVQLEILIAAPRDDVVSHGTRAQASTTCSRQRWHVARLALGIVIFGMEPTAPTIATARNVLEQRKPSVKARACLCGGSLEFTTR